MLPETFTPTFLKRLELLRLHSRRTFFGLRQGGHLSLRRGHGIEFADYRKYEPGDNPRHIDWSIFARSDRLYVRTFREEQDLTLLIILDTSASMMTPVSDRKWERAKDIALALSYIGLMEQDTVTISALGYANTPFYYGPRAFHEAARLLGSLKIGGGSNMRREVEIAVRRIRIPGKAVFISDFLLPMEDTVATMDLLRSRGLDIAAIQVLGRNDIEPLLGVTDAHAIDSESGEEVDLTLDDDARAEYSKILSAHNQAIKEYFGEHQIAYATTRPDESLENFVIENLTDIGLLK